MDTEPEENRIMAMKPGLFAMAIAGLAVGLTGCGGSSDPGATQPEATASRPSSTPVPTTSAPAPTTPGTTPSTTASPKSSAGTSAQRKAFITIKDFTYKVPTSVAGGSAITVKNADGEAHTVTSVPASAFDAKAFGNGGTATFKAPAKPGRYRFTCIFHGDMMATLVVR